MEFHTASIEEIDRHTEPVFWETPVLEIMPPKHEEITLTIKLTGSGDTRTFSSEEIMSIIMEKIRTIKPTI